MSNKLDSLIEKYGERDTIKDRKIELKLKYIKELYGECGKSEEMHLFAEIVENFCEILESVQPADQERSMLFRGCRMNSRSSTSSALMKSFLRCFGYTLAISMPKARLQIILTV